MKKMISLRIPPETEKQLNEICNRFKGKKTQVIIWAIESLYFEHLDIIKKGSDQRKGE